MISALSPLLGIPAVFVPNTTALDPNVALFFATTDIAGNEAVEVIAQHGKLISKPGEGYDIDGSTAKPTANSSGPSWMKYSAENDCFIKHFDLKSPNQVLFRIKHR